VLVTPDNCNASYAGTAVYKAPPNLIKQEIYFAIQTFFGAVKKHGCYSRRRFPPEEEAKRGWPLWRLVFIGASDAIAKSTCRLNASTRTMKTRTSSPTLNRFRDRLPINRRCAGSNT